MAKIRPSGGYRDLRSFQIATVIYDATYWFCERFVEPRSRMQDQMVQAARSGRQNIAEGSRASATSSQTELRLMNVARSSLEELLLDYEDFLRHRHLTQWRPNSPEALAVRKIGRERPNSPDQNDPSDRTNQIDLSDQARYALYAAWLDHENPAIRANALLCLIHQTNYLLDKQIEALEAQFIEEGGYSEQLATARLAERNRQKNGQAFYAARSSHSTQSPHLSRLPHPSDPTDLSHLIPTCPLCGKLMALRTAQKGRNAGKQFWGCTGYPDCKGVVNL
jgi:four helix bundle suffix protein